MSVSTEFANFLAVAWQMPASRLDTIFMGTDSMEERNMEVHLEAFIMYLFVFHDIKNYEELESKMQTRLFDDYYDEFLLASVKQRYLI